MVVAARLFHVALELLEDAHALRFERDGFEGGVALELRPELVPRRLVVDVLAFEEAAEGVLQLLQAPVLLLLALAFARLGLLQQRVVRQLHVAGVQRQRPFVFAHQRCKVFERRVHLPHQNAIGSTSTKREAQSSTDGR